MRVLHAMLEISSYLPPELYQKLCKWIHIKDILGCFFLIMQSCLMCYRTCFKKINNNLVHMQKIMINDIKPCVPSLIYHLRRSQFLLIELRILKKQHLTVSNTMKMLNIIFSPQLLATLVLTFTEITFELYKHLIQWQDGLSFILDDEIDDVFFLMSIGYEFLKIILIVWTCETNKNRALEISTTVHDVLNRTSDEQIKEEMTGNVTTYILILTQFMIMVHSCDGKAANNIRMT
ncbi:PREDICTED: uncharacterized protein LOC108693541 [Atta colombica]|uniref:uncharacterized protein LOC108693541 n=1 Tax=Atta colombica TaxID=520822 RepID=UPI00084C19EE|nr:PREDICTED: uncharacterized protein LOC108693541 [Atta colombica]